MEDGKTAPGRETGRYLARPQTEYVHRRYRIGRWLTVTVLMVWDALLLYMIVRCLIEPVYGAAFIAVVSIYLGYHL